MSLEEYLILNRQALVLKPVFTGENLTEIITIQGSYFSKLSISELLNRACLYFYSTMKGRMDATKKLFGYLRKPPFLIWEDFGVFPVISPTRRECIWVFSNFSTAKAVGPEQTLLTYTDNFSVEVPVSLHVIKRQKYRVHMLLSHAKHSLIHKTPNPEHEKAWIEYYEKLILVDEEIPPHDNT